MRVALITGITGQDGSYLAELLLSKGYEVHGIVRRSSTFNTGRIDHIFQDPHDSPRLFLHYGDLSDSEQLGRLIYGKQIDEVYHLGAQSHVRVSFDAPEYTGNVTALGTARLLEAIRGCGRRVRMYQASSSEMFGSAAPSQNENTPLCPRSPYGCAKVYAYHMARNYRDGYGMHVSNGILFNHESPRRGETFVTRKVTRGIAAIVTGKQKKLYLGNLSAMRDWGFAPEYVEGMWKILQIDKPVDLVLGTGESQPIRHFVEDAFSYAGLDWTKHVEIDARYIRPTEVDYLLADPQKALETIGWEPKVNAHDLAKIMIDADLRAAGAPCPGEGDAIIKERFPARWWGAD